MKIIITKEQYKTLLESVEGKSSLENLIYEFLNDDFYPDYDWGPELFDFYREDVEQHGLVPFYINDSEAYTYYDDGTLEIMPWVCEKLNEYFNDLWYSVFKSWFEENSGLKVNMIVDSRNDNRLLEESTDNSNAVKQIMDDEGIEFKGCEYDGRTFDSFGRQRDKVAFYFKVPMDPDHTYRKLIYFLTKNNKVVNVYTSGDFRTISDGFKYIPTDVLMDYFINIGENFLNNKLPELYPNDNINESQYNKLVSNITGKNVKQNFFSVIKNLLNGNKDQKVGLMILKSVEEGNYEFEKIDDLNATIEFTINGFPVKVSKVGYYRLYLPFLNENPLNVEPVVCKDIFYELAKKHMDSDAFFRVFFSDAIDSM